MPTDGIAANGRLMYTGVCLSAVAHRLALEGDGLVGRCVVVSSYATFGCGRFGPVCSVGPDWFVDLSDALGFVDWHEAADAAWLYDDIGFHGHEYEVWHIVADPVTAPVAAVDAVPGSSRAARGGSVSGALTGEHDGVFEVPITQFVTWRHEHDHGMPSDVLTEVPAAGDLVYRSRGVDVSGVRGPVRVGDWFLVTTCAAFGSPALDVWAFLILPENLRYSMSRDRLSSDVLCGVGGEYEWWRVIEDPRPEWVRLPGHDGDSWYWDEQPGPQPSGTWYEIDLDPEVV